jgi:hypothetical protein
MTNQQAPTLEQFQALLLLNKQHEDSIKALELVWTASQTVISKQQKEIEDLTGKVTFWKNEYEECSQQSMKALQELYNLKNNK